MQLATRNIFRYILFFALALSFPSFSHSSFLFLAISFLHSFFLSSSPFFLPFLSFTSSLSFFYIYPSSLYCIFTSIPRCFLYFLPSCLYSFFTFFFLCFLFPFVLPLHSLLCLFLLLFYFSAFLHSFITSSFPLTLLFSCSKPTAFFFLHQYLSFIPPPSFLLLSVVPAAGHVTGLDFTVQYRIENEKMVSFLLYYLIYPRFYGNIWMETNKSSKAWPQKSKGQ